MRPKFEIVFFRARFRTGGISSPSVTLPLLRPQPPLNLMHNIYVPIVLKNVTSLGITPCKRRNLFGVKVLPGVREL